MTFQDLLQNAVSLAEEENRDTIIINRILSYCVDVGILKHETCLGYDSHERLKAALIKQLCSVHLSYIAEQASQPEIKTSEEINIKINSLLKWVSRKHSEKIFPFGK